MGLNRRWLRNAKAEVERLRGTVKIEYTLARLGAERLWKLLQEEDYVPTILLARTDANAASLLTSDVDERDKPFITGERTSEGFYRVREGIDHTIQKVLFQSACFVIILA